MNGPPPDLKDVHQRLVAILTAHLAGDTLTERSLVKEILEDDMLAESFASLENLTYELIRVLAKERNTSPENLLRVIALGLPRAREGLPDPKRLAPESHAKSWATTGATASGHSLVMRPPL
jgi:hypothetical protein